MFLELSRCTVRSWRSEDVRDLAEQANNPNVWLNMPDSFPAPYRPEDAQAFIKARLWLQPETHFAIVVDGRAAGAIGYDVKTDIERFTAEVGFWVGQKYWNRGIATDAVRGLCAEIWRETSVVRIQARVFDSNVGSRRVLEKCGFELEGRLRKAFIKDERAGDLLVFGMTRKMPEVG